MKNIVSVGEYLLLIDVNKFNLYTKYIYDSLNKKLLIQENCICNENYYNVLAHLPLKKNKIDNLDFLPKLDYNLLPEKFKIESKINNQYIGKYYY